MGAADARANVSVNGLNAYWKGESFWKEVSVANSSAPAYASLSATTTLNGNGQTTSGSLFVPQTPELFDDPSTPAVNGIRCRW